MYLLHLYTNVVLLKKKKTYSMYNFDSHFALHSIYSCGLICWLSANQMKTEPKYYARNIIKRKLSKQVTTKPVRLQNLKFPSECRASWSRVNNSHAQTEHS